MIHMEVGFDFSLIKHVPMDSLLAAVSACKASGHPFALKEAWVLTD